MKPNFTMAKLIQDYVKPVVYCAWRLSKSFRAGCLYSWRLILDDVATVQQFELHDLATGV